MNNFDLLVHVMSSNIVQQSLQLSAATSKVDDRAKNSSARLICRYHKSDSMVRPFIKFGPLFGQDEDYIKKAKEEAWQYVVSSSKSRKAIVTEIYMSSIRKIENIAKACYVPDSVLDKLSRKDFRDMMLKDSCLFLQLLFSLLRDDDDEKLDDFPHLRNISLSNRHLWLESMLHVGNQIPMVVLRELLKKSYFQEVIKNVKWKEPSFDLAKKALFRVLLSPELYRPPRWCINFPFVGKDARRLMHWTQQLKECCDVLHGIHLLLLGPEKEEYDNDDDDDDDFDMEEDYNRGVDDINTNDALAGGSRGPDDAGGAAGYSKAKKEDDNDGNNNNNDDNVKNVIKLKQAGVHFGITKEGIRGIKFKSNLIYPKLYLPPLFVGSHTRLLLQRLKQYEQNLDSSLREVSSYLQFLRDLVHTTQDAKILALDGIIQGNRKYIQKLPTILIGLAPNGKTIDTSLNPVKIEINTFYRPSWVSEYFTIVFLLSFLAALISIVQTVYAILAYHKPPSR